jgi:hypothetical protein
MVNILPPWRMQITRRKGMVRGIVYKIAVLNDRYGNKDREPRSF